MTDNEAIEALARNGMVITDHNIECMKFAKALKDAGGEDLLDTVCFEGSPAQAAAKAADDLQRLRDTGTII